jgi:3-hydroxyisobutyrate dehydrogenase-like beta-hydroxyacid dehydrogenase
LVSASDYILSIVPPRDAVSTATRISTAFNAQPSPKPTPLYFLDLNAISPRSARSIAEIFSTKSPAIKFLDGGIIGGAPSIKSSAAPPTTVSSYTTTDATWSKPSVPISGSISSIPSSYSHFAETMNIKHISDEIGTASGLKCCFATTTKGFTALCIQAFTTASNLGVLPNLLEEMEERTPGMVKRAKGGVTGMPPKAYRWVKESKYPTEPFRKRDFHSHNICTHSNPYL